MPPASAWRSSRIRDANPGRGYRGAPTDAPDAAIRLRVPDDRETVVADTIRGEIRFRNDLQDDPVIARADGSVLYNFAVAVDDADMKITDVIRGDDHLSNTPRQLLVLAALGESPPRYAHLPLLHGPDQEALQAPRRRLGSGAARVGLPAKRSLERIAAALARLDQAA